MYEKIGSDLPRIEMEFTDFDIGYLDTLEDPGNTGLSEQADDHVPLEEGAQKVLEHEAASAEAAVLQRLRDLLGDTSVRREIVIEFGRCGSADPEVFFPERGGSTKEAKRICAECPVRTDCLELAIDNDERFGVWGGYSERERRKLKQQRRSAE